MAKFGRIIIPESDAHCCIRMYIDVLVTRIAAPHAHQDALVIDELTRIAALHLTRAHHYVNASTHQTLLEPIPVAPLIGSL